MSQNPATPDLADEADFANLLETVVKQRPTIENDVTIKITREPINKEPNGMIYGIKGIEHIGDRKFLIGVGLS